ncbi:MAG: EndoU domain-containing protein [Alphaproteobacteria bacterium]|nr:EndoU domain-containing protein [Alphaproteobacteria bacterium]MCB9974754.1 EndoU domain-containing protein [Rhodospirillales bacterium]
MKNRQLIGFIAVLTLLLTALITGQPEQQAAPAAQNHRNFSSGAATKTSGSGAVKLSEQRINHILYGDKTGGGHKHGMNKPCKSEFPADWNDRKIIDTINKIAANDNTNWKTQDNGYLVTDTKIENLKIRVVMNPEKPEIITAYPTNVPRNPCRAANDNNP